MSQNPVADIFDVFFNGRPAPKDNNTTTSPKGVSLDELISRGSSVVRVGRKYYRVTVEEVTIATTPKRDQYTK